MFARIAGLIFIVLGGFLIAQPVTDSTTIEPTSENGWLGMRATNFEPQGPNGLLFVIAMDVDRAGPAYQAGIRTGQLILSINGKEIDTTEDMPAMPAGVPVDMEIANLITQEAFQATVTPTTEQNALINRPFLMLSPDHVRDEISGLDVNQQAGIFASASLDGTVQVRNLQSGELIRSFVSANGLAIPPTATAVAISPNGRHVATVGNSGYIEDLFQIAWPELRIFEIDTGKLVKRKALSGASWGPDIAYSPSGEFIAIAQGAEDSERHPLGDTPQNMLTPDYQTHFSLSIYRSGDLSLVKRHSFPELPMSVDFSHDGRIAVPTQDGFVHLYNANFELVAKTKTPPSFRPFQIAFSPDGKKIALGQANGYEVRILSGTDLSLQKVLKGQNSIMGDRGIFRAVTWSSDGRYLFAGGVHFREGGEMAVRRWALDTYDSVIDLDAGIFPQLLQPWGKGGVIAGNESGDLIAYDGSGDLVFDKETRSVDFSAPNNIDQTLVSHDGRKLEIELFPVLYKNHILRFDVNSRSLDSYSGTDRPQDNENGTRFFRTKRNGPGIEITVSDDRKEARFNGTVLPEFFSWGSNEIEHVAVAQNGQGFALVFSRSSSSTIVYYNSDGSHRWAEILIDTVGRLNVSGDGKLLIATLRDGTIRWYRTRDGVELLALYISAQKTTPDIGPQEYQFKWILWTPEGYYDASAGGEDLVGWRVNQGADKEALYYGASRFRDLYYRPDIIQTTLETLEVTKAPSRNEFAALLPPVVRILAIDESVEGRASVRYEINSPSGKPITEFRALVDGRVYDLSRSRAEVATGIQQLDVVLQPGDQQITLVAATEDGFGEEETRGLARIFDPDKPVERNLYALVIGISDYQDDDLRDLSFADDDAKDVTAALTAQSNSFYRNVETKTLMDGEATRDAILGALDWLRTAPGDQDVSLLFLAGHGINQLQTGQLTGDVPTGTYYFLPNDVDLNSLSSTGVSYDDLLEYIHHARGYKILALDTCHSGQVDSNGLVNRFASDENGVIVFASSTASQTSTEKADWENGAFTEALLEGLEGQADDPRLPDQLIDHLELGGWLNLRVKNLTNGNQTPIVGTSRAIPATTIAAVVGQ